MTLDDYSDIATILSSVVSVFLLSVSTILAVLLYKWNCQTAKIETSRRHSESLRHYNELVLSDPDLQKLVAQNHRWGILDEGEVVKMYRYFLLLNIASDLHESIIGGSIDKNLYKIRLDNYANTTYQDRDFIIKHVFSRGYSKSFRQEIINRWEYIEKHGTITN